MNNIVVFITDIDNNACAYHMVQVLGAKNDQDVDKCIKKNYPSAVRINKFNNYGSAGEYLDAIAADCRSIQKKNNWVIQDNCQLNNISCFSSNENFSERLRRCFSLMGYKISVELLDDKYRTIKSMSIYTEADSEREAKSQINNALTEKYGDKYKIIDIEYPKSSSSCDKHIFDL